MGTLPGCPVAHRIDDNLKRIDDIGPRFVHHFKFIISKHNFFHTWQNIFMNKGFPLSNHLFQGFKLCFIKRLTI